MISNEKNAKKANLTSQIILCSIPILNFVSQPYAFYKIGKLRQFLIYYATVISISSSLIVAGNLRQELEILKIYGLVFIFVAGYIFPIIWVFFWTKKFNREVQAENLWRINEAQKNHLKKIDERRIFDSQNIPERIDPTYTGKLYLSDLDDNFIRLEWYDAEDVVGKLFEKKGYQVKVTQKTNDFGIDVEAKSPNEYLGIQVKHWETDVGFEDVAKTLGVSNKFNKVIIISTKSNFTRQAMIFANDGTNRYRIDLWDNRKFKNELRKIYFESFTEKR